MDNSTEPTEIDERKKIVPVNVDGYWEREKLFLGEVGWEKEREDRETFVQRERDSYWESEKLREKSNNRDGGKTREWVLRLEREINSYWAINLWRERERSIGLPKLCGLELWRRALDGLTFHMAVPTGWPERVDREVGKPKVPTQLAATSSLANHVGSGGEEGPTTGHKEGPTTERASLYLPFLT